MLGCLLLNVSHLSKLTDTGMNHFALSDNEEFPIQIEDKENGDVDSRVDCNIIPLGADYVDFGDPECVLSLVVLRCGSIRELGMIEILLALSFLSVVATTRFSYHCGRNHLNTYHNLYSRRNPHILSILQSI